MKLLLTSAGLSNKTIVQALENLLGKPSQGVRLAFIPTAANVEEGDKSWMITDLVNYVKAGIEVDIVDISALPKNNWLPRLEQAQVLFFGGGNTFHLMHWVKKSGLQNELSRLLKSRVYGGISAGSCIAGPTIYNSVQNLFGEKYELTIKKGLGLVDFQFIPHLNSPFFENIRDKNLKQASKNMKEVVYALDDSSAIVVRDGDVQVVSEGEWKVYR